MRNFCTDIQETAKLRGITKGGQCRNRNGGYSVTTTTTEHIHISINYYTDEELGNNKSDSGLKKIFSEVIDHKGIEQQNMDILNNIINQFIR